ncbi:MAG: hypothetical protein AAFX01_12545 [Cyanobacteria bacterium J06638_28]
MNPHKPCVDLGTSIAFLQVNYFVETREMYQTFFLGLFLLGQGNLQSYFIQSSLLEVSGLESNPISSGLSEETSSENFNQGIFLSESLTSLESSPIAGFLKVTEGMGEITSSVRHDLVAPGTNENQVTGGYSPSSRQLVLEIAGRQVQITLNEPLVENENITYQITRVVPRFTGSPSVSRFPKLVQNSVIVLHPVTGGGTLRLTNGQITGDFTVRSRYVCGRFEIEDNFSISLTDNCSDTEAQQNIEDGLVTGKFSLKVNPGSASDIPELR